MCCLWVVCMTILAHPWAHMILYEQRIYCGKKYLKDFCSYLRHRLEIQSEIFPTYLAILVLSAYN